MEKRKIGLVARIIMIGGVPLCIAMLVLTVMAAVDMNSALIEESERGLAKTATALRSVLEDSYEGTFSLNEEGKLVKGEVDLEILYNALDDVKAQENVELTVFFGDTRLMTTLRNEDGSRNVGTQANADVATKVLGGENYFDGHLQIGGSKYFAYYVPLRNADGSICGMVFAGAPSENVDSAINGSIMKIVGIAVVMLIIALALIIITAGVMAKSIKSVTSGIMEMTKGDLSTEFDETAYKRSDEIGEIARNAGQLRNTLWKMLGEITDEVGNINRYAGNLNDMSVHSCQSTNEVSLAIEDVAKGATSQAEETETATRHVEDVSVMIDGIVDNIGVLTEQAKEMGKSGTDATRILAELNNSNQKTTDAIKRITKQTEETNESVKAISQAAEVITSIAEETNLLALNASIEAARAGEHGRGFAVVADSIQKLAEQSNGSAREIMDIINALIQESEKTVETMREVNVIVEEEGERVDETKMIIGKVAEGIEKSLAEIDMINDKAGTIKGASAEISTVIQSLSAISEENAAATEETNASVEELNAMMEELAQEANELHTAADHVKALVGQFKI